MPEVGEYVSAGQDVGRAFAAPTPWNIGRAVYSVARLAGFGKHKPKRMFSGTIDAGAGTVNLCTHHPQWCRKHPKTAASANAALSAYLRGEGPAPSQRRRQYLVSEIDRVREAMRLRPLTMTESVAWGQMTPASKTLGALLPGGRGPARRRKRRAGKKNARRARRSRARAPARRASRRGGRRQRLVKGSAAAKAWGRKMRRLRRR